MDEIVIGVVRMSFMIRSFEPSYRSSAWARFVVDPVLVLGGTTTRLGILSGGEARDGIEIGSTTGVGQASMEVMLRVSLLVRWFVGSLDITLDLLRREDLGRRHRGR